MDQRKTAIARLLECTRKFDGIRIDEATIILRRDRQNTVGSRIVAEPLRNILDPETFATIQRATSTGCYADGLEMCVSVAGFGALLGEAVVSTFGKSTTENQSSLDWAALWNLLMAYLDDICDEYGTLLPLLLTRLNHASLQRALNPSLNTRLMPEPTDPVLLRFVIQIADAVFRRYRSLVNRISRSDYVRLAEAIELAYLSEIKTAQLRFSDIINTGDVYKHLRASSSLPVWIFGCITILDSGLTSLSKMLELCLSHIGDVLWLLDDLVDLEEDVGTDRWNAIFLIAIEHHGQSVLPKLRELTPDDRMTWLYEEGLPLILADRILDSLIQALEILNKSFGKGTSLANELASILWSWSNEMPKQNC